MSIHFTLLSTPPLPPAGQRSHWQSLPGVAAASAVLESVKAHRQFALVIARDNVDANEWYEYFRLLNNGPDKLNVGLFPDQEVLPYDHFSPHPDITSERLRVLYALQQSNVDICIASVGNCLMRLCPSAYVNRDTLMISLGQTIDIQQIKYQLGSAGYQHRDSVYEHGEYAMRGALFDVFPMGSNKPFRIELFDSEIESIRTFDPETQRTLEKIDQIAILPASEVSLDNQAISLFRDNWHIEFQHDPDACPVYRESVAGISSAGIEAYLPMFYENTETLLEYIPDNSLVFGFEDMENRADSFITEVASRYQSQSIDPTRPLLRPEKLYLRKEEFFQQLKQVPRIDISSASDIEQPVSSVKKQSRGFFQLAASPNPELLVDAHAEQAMSRISQFLQTQDRHTLFCVESTGRGEVFRERLREAGITSELVNDWSEFISYTKSSTSPVASIVVAAFNKGASFVDAGISIIAEPELFGVSIKPRASSKKSKAGAPDSPVHSLIELRVGSPIVHIDHGVGRYLGLTHLSVDGFDAEFMTLEYAGGDKLYVPVTSLHMINRYVGGDEVTAPLHKLGNELWQQNKDKAIKNVRDVAAELLDIYARRKSLTGFQHNIPEDDYRQFADRFPFEETPDQLTAIEAVLADMASETPMDRLVCGDVGFGKTEVAMRAAFVTACNSKQIMLLVPTTLLAQQHYQNFVDRFSDWPIQIEVLSRFKTAKEQSTILNKFTAGSIDILIGTHKLLQKDVIAHQLGLVVVDEEHRFGVRQKEQLKKICANVDLLTMTATPIPRTLNMAMAGIRDLSIIATPPARRLSVKTFVNEKQKSTLKEALLREILRGGQVFYLHNDVNSIEKAAEEVKNLVEDARICIGHGQMPERQLEQVMSDFYHKKYNVLVCTTIIETGIDIPNANTIIIDRADKFGLAQLHQLRGRVGRSHHQAYAYLFIPHRKRLTADACKRLDAIAESQDLGAGFILATHDLEIRGAGELLGDEQSGQMQSIGFTLYLDLLERAVQSLKSGDEIDIEAPMDVMGEINLHLPALIPDDYLPDVHNRLLLYKRIANAKSSAELRDLQVEMIDRFGLLVDEIKNLFSLTEIKICCVAAGIEKVDVGANGGFIEFSRHTSVDPMTIVNLVQQESHCFRLSGATRLLFNIELETATDRISWVAELVDKLTTTKNSSNPQLAPT